MKFLLIFSRLLIFVLLYNSVMTITAQNWRVKQKLSIAIRTEGNYIDTTTTKEVYNKTGKLVLREQPKYYCTEQYEYDSLDRPITEDIMCGESNGNGIIRLFYNFPHKIVQQGEFGAYPIYLQEDSLNTQGLKTISKKWRSSIHDDSTYTEIRYVYTSTHKISSKIEFVQHYFKENNQWIADFKTNTEQKYMYDKRDSLLKIVFMDLLTNQSRILEEYVYNSKGLIEKITYFYSSGSSRKIFLYDVRNQVIKAKLETLDTIKKAWILESQTDFIYNNGELIQENTNSYWQGNLRSIITNYYEKALLVRSVETDKQHKVVEKTTYEYEFFE